MNKTILYVLFSSLFISYCTIYIINYFSIINYNKNYYYNLLNIKYNNQYINKKYSIILIIIIFYYTYFFIVNFSISLYFIEIYIFWILFIILAHIDAYTKTIPLFFSILLIFNGFFFGFINKYLLIYKTNLNIIFYSNEILLTKNLTNKTLGMLSILFFFIIIKNISYYIFNKYQLKNAIGFGDIIILLAIGSNLGIEILPLILFLSSILGILYYTIRKIFFYKYKIKLLNKKLFDKNIYISIPFIPFLFMGTCITWILYYMKILII